MLELEVQLWVSSWLSIHLWGHLCLHNGVGAGTADLDYLGPLSKEVRNPVAGGVSSRSRSIAEE